MTEIIKYIKLSMSQSSTYHVNLPFYGNNLVSSNYLIIFDCKIFINKTGFSPDP